MLFERKTFRRMMKEINAIGGYKLLECLPTDAVESILDNIIEDRLALKKL